MTLSKKQRLAAGLPVVRTNLFNGRTMDELHLEAYAMEGRLADARLSWLRIGVLRYREQVHGR